MARANGKVILLGEHAVVYGVPAIAAGIERGVEAQATLGGEASTLRVGDHSAQATDQSDLGRAFQALLSELQAPPLTLEISLELPAGSGLGASAAMGVASARAVLSALGKPAEP